MNFLQSLKFFLYLWKCTKYITFLWFDFCFLNPYSLQLLWLLMEREVVKSYWGTQRWSSVGFVSAVIRCKPEVQQLIWRIKVNIIYQGLKFHSVQTLALQSAGWNDLTCPSMQICKQLLRYFSLFYPKENLSFLLERGTILNGEQGSSVEVLFLILPLSSKCLECQLLLLKPFHNGVSAYPLGSWWSLPAQKPVSRLWDACDNDGQPMYLAAWELQLQTRNYLVK